ncbi:MAG: AraC family transcriptional regulator [Minicystis sp.]
MAKHAEERWMAAAHALQIAELSARWGVGAEDLFAGLALDVESLSDPRLRLPLSLVEQLAARAKALTGEPGLGFYLGLSMRVSSHGYLGFAAMASPTVRDALDVAVRFAPTRTDAIALRVQESGGVASIVIDELAPLGAARDVIITSFVVGLHQIGATITGQRIEDSADLALPEPDHAARFRHLLGGRIRYGQPSNQLVFPASVLALPLVQADPVALRLAREQCERELGALGYEGRVSARVRAILPCPDGFRSIDQAAARLGMSARTLKRRLADEGTSFSAVLDEERRARALLLLRSPQLSIEAVADGVGYSDVANFTRAFRRWTGTTPTSYRRAAMLPVRS